MQVQGQLRGFVGLCALAGSLAACGGGSASGAGESGGSSDGSSGSAGSGGGEATGGGGDDSTGSSSSESSGGDTSSTGNSSSNGSSGGDTSSNAGSNTSAGLINGTPVALEDYGQAVGEALCPAVTPCCAAQFDIDVSNAECAATLALLFSDDYTSANPNNYSYDPELAGDCVATGAAFYEDLQCDFDAIEEVDDSESVDQLCDAVFTGRLAPGEPCGSDVECAAGPGEDASCRDIAFDDNYVCVVEFRASAGDACYWTCTEEGLTTACGGSSNDSGDGSVRGECYTNDGLFCSSEGVCERQVGLGESCTDDSHCRGGYCSPQTDQCAARVGAGADCDSDSWCAEGLHCPESTCEPLLAEGQACSSSSECSSGLCSDDLCSSGEAAGALAMALLCGVISGQSL